MRKRLEEAHNPETSPRRLWRLSWSTSKAVVAAVAANPSTPRSALRHIIRWHTHPDILNRIPHHAQATPSILRALARHHAALNPGSLLAIVYQDACPDDIIRIVCTGKTKGAELAACYLAHQESTEAENLRDLAFHYSHSPRVLDALAGNPQTPSDILQTWLHCRQPNSTLMQRLASNSGLSDSDRALAALRLLNLRTTTSA